MAMPVCTNAQLLVNIFTLDDVTARDDYKIANSDNSFYSIVEAAARQVAEDYFRGKTPEGPDYVDWNGSRLQFWKTRKAGVCKLLIFQYDYNHRPPLLCCQTQDIIYGEQHLIAQYAVIGDGRTIHIERLPECDTRRRHRAPRPIRTPSVPPTLHRLLEKSMGLLRRLREAAARIPQRTRSRSSSPMLGLVNSFPDTESPGMPLRSAARRIKRWMKQLSPAFGEIKVFAIFGCTSTSCLASTTKSGGNSGNPFSTLMKAIDRLRKPLLELFKGDLPFQNRHIDDLGPSNTDDTAFRIDIEFKSDNDHLAAIHGLKPDQPSGQREPGVLPAKIEGQKEAIRSDLPAGGRPRPSDPAGL